MEQEVGIESGRKKRRTAKIVKKKDLRRIAKMVVMQEKSIPEAMVAVGFSPTTANDHPERIARNPEYKEAENELRHAIRSHDPEIFKKVAVQVSEGLQANRVISAIAKSGEKEANGTTTDFVEVPDHAVRLKHSEFVAKVFGQLNETVQGNVVFNVSKFYQLVVNAEKERGLA